MCKVQSAIIVFAVANDIIHLDPGVQHRDDSKEHKFPVFVYLSYLLLRATSGPAKIVRFLWATSEAIQLIKMCVHNGRTQII